MRIIDKRRDYYDGVQRTGQDPTCVYVRTEQEIDLRCDGDIWLGRGIPDRQFVVGFCGKLYPCLYVPEFKRQYYGDCVSYYAYPDPTRFFYSASAALKALLIFAKKDGCPLDKKVALRNVDRIFDVNRFKFLLPIFRDHRVPCFVGICHQKQPVVINPLLRYYGFQKVVGPYQTFQQIHAFLAGVLGTETMPIPELDDVTKAEIHGFNKESFRHSKGVKPNRKRRKNPVTEKRVK